MDWFLYNNGLRLERVNKNSIDFKVSKGWALNFPLKLNQIFNWINMLLLPQEFQKTMLSRKLLVALGDGTLIFHSQMWNNFHICHQFVPKLFPRVICSSECLAE